MAVIVTIARASLLMTPPKTPQELRVIMATCTRDTLIALSQCLPSPPLPLSECLERTRPNPTITVFVRRRGTQNTVVTAVASPSRVKALLRACALLDAG